MVAVGPHRRIPSGIISTLVVAGIIAGIGLASFYLVAPSISSHTITSTVVSTTTEARLASTVTYTLATTSFQTATIAGSNHTTTATLSIQVLVTVTHTDTTTSTTVLATTTATIAASTTTTISTTTATSTTTSVSTSTTTATSTTTTITTTTPAPPSHVPVSGTASSKVPGATVTGIHFVGAGSGLSFSGTLSGGSYTVSLPNSDTYNVTIDYVSGVSMTCSAGSLAIYEGVLMAVNANWSC